MVIRLTHSTQDVEQDEKPEVFKEEKKTGSLNKLLYFKYGASKIILVSQSSNRQTNQNNQIIAIWTITIILFYLSAIIK